MNNTIIMKKVIIIGIIVSIIIGVIGITVSENSTDKVENSLGNNQVPTSTEIKNEPRQFTIGLSESMGFKETP